MKKDYIGLAQKLTKANFRIYGVGNFDLSQEETATILELLEKDGDVLVKYYEKLEQKRMG